MHSSLLGHETHTRGLSVVLLVHEQATAGFDMGEAPLSNAPDVQYRGSLLTKPVDSTRLTPLLLIDGDVAEGVDGGEEEQYCEHY
jgi:hypothetical protein